MNSRLPAILAAAAAGRIRPGCHAVAKTIDGATGRALTGTEGPDKITGNGRRGPESGAASQAMIADCDHRPDTCGRGNDWIRSAPPLP